MTTAPLVQSLAAETSGGFVPTRASRPWQVLHTCDSILEVADVVAGQLAVGMRPSVVTQEGFVIFADALRAKRNETPSQNSLLNAWNDVRHWRKVILDADPLSEFDLLHAHSFAAGMAGVRNYPATVYDIDQFIEEIPNTSPSGAASDAAEQSSWLSRSFRVAEQFVLSRAAAVVVRTESMRQAVVRRGASAEHVFAVPSIFNEEERKPVMADPNWLHSLDISAQRTVIYAPKWKMELAADGSLSESSRGLLQSFSVAAAEEDSCYIVVESEDNARHAAQQYAEQLQIAGRVRFIAQVDAERAWNSANIIISDLQMSISRNAMIDGKVLLAADLPCNRDVTPNGRGCLWYRHGDYKDIGHRMAFLAHNQEFRESLAAAGTQHLIETCNPAAVAMQYDAIYRLAAARRKSGGLQTPAIRLSPASAML